MTVRSELRRLREQPEEAARAYRYRSRDLGGVFFWVPGKAQLRKTVVPGIQGLGSGLANLSALPRAERLSAAS